MLLCISFSLSSLFLLNAYIYRCVTDKNSLIFLSLSLTEARPAKEAGLKSAVVVRPGNKALSQEEKNEFDILESFKELWPEWEDQKDGQKDK